MSRTSSDTGPGGGLPRIARLPRARMHPIRRAIREAAGHLARLYGLQPAHLVDELAMQRAEAKADLFAMQHVEQQGAFQVKLDILEGAVSVLDERTRVVVAEPSPATVLAGLRARLDELERIARQGVSELAGTEAQLGVLEEAISALDQRMKPFSGQPSIGEPCSHWAQR